MLQRWKHSRTIGFVAGIAGLGLALSGCVAGGDTTAGGDGTGTITIGIKYDQPGLGMQVGNSYEGFDVDVARYVAHELGYDDSQITFQEAPSAQRETLIQSGQVDLVFATYSVTDERKEKVSFAGPYFIAGQDVMVAADNTDINGPEDLEGRVLCSVVGSTSAKAVQDRYPGVQLQEVDTYSKCAEAVAAGSMDAVSTDDIILAGYASQPEYEGDFRVVGNPFTEEHYGVGLAKDNEELRGQVDAAIQKMIDEGVWQQALDDNVGGAGYTPNAETNPPTPGTA